MIEKDTVRLLRECDAGVKMGISSIEDVAEYAAHPALRELLAQGRKDHQTLDRDLQKELDRFQDEGKDPALMAKGMSWLKTNVKLAVDLSDATIADLMTDGCNMGVKSLNKYLNQYKAADEVSKDIAKRLIHLEEQLAIDVRGYL